MTTPNVYDLDVSLVALIEELGFPVGLVDLPVITPGLPYFVVHPTPYSNEEGSMAGANEIQEMNYIVKTIGGEYEQARRAQVQLHSKLSEGWASLAGVMGPPRLAVGATLREDERTFNSNDLITVKVSGA